MGLPVEAVERELEQPPPRRISRELRRQAGRNLSKLGYYIGVPAFIFGASFAFLLFPWVAVFGFDPLPGVGGLPKEDLRTVFVPIFALIGPIFFIITWRGRHRAFWLLRHGVFTHGKVTDIGAGGMIPTQDASLPSNQSQASVTITFEANAQKQEYTYGVTDLEADVARKRKENEEPIGVLYDPRSPNRCITISILV